MASTVIEIAEAVAEAAEAGTVEVAEVAEAGAGAFEGAEANVMRGFAKDAFKEIAKGAGFATGFFGISKLLETWKTKQEKNPNHDKKEEVGILMVGLRGAGKTTILKAMDLHPVVTTVPPIGLTLETVKHAGVTLTALDVGEKDQEPPFWIHFCQDARCLIFVVDSNDRTKFSEAAQELHRMLGEDKLRGKPLLVYANKKDIEGAMSTSEITDKLSLPPLNQRPWHIQATCAISGEGLKEGFEWLISQM